MLRNVLTALEFSLGLLGVLVVGIFAALMAGLLAPPLVAAVLGALGVWLFRALHLPRPR